MSERDRSERQYGQQPCQPTTGGRQTQAGRLVAWFVILIGLTLWSFLAWIGYSSADGILNWIAGNADTVVENGKTIGRASGIGKDAITVIEGLKLGDLAGSAIALLKIVLKPAIIVIWAIGASVLVAVPLILAKAGRFLVGLRR